MRFSSISWVTFCARTALTMAGCQSAMTPDAGQATAPVATASAPAMGRGGRGGPAQAPANLGAAMRDMNAMLTAIKGEATDPAKIDQTIHDISVLARDVAIAKLQTPPYVNQIPTAADKAKALASFRSMMNGLTRTLLDREDAVNAKKPDDVKKAIATLEEMEKAGHTEFHVGG